MYFFFFNFGSINRVTRRFECTLLFSGYKTRILLQVHDELVLEAPEAEVDQAARLTREVMSTAFALNVPLVVDVEAGKNWLDMEAV